MSKSTPVIGTPVRSTKFTNAEGFNPTASQLGADTMPGPAKGAPMLNSKSVDDYTARKTVYQPGVYPGSMTTPTNGVMGLEKDAPTHDGPAAKGPQVHPDLMTKADNAAQAESEFSNMLKRMGQS